MEDFTPFDVFDVLLFVMAALLTVLYVLIGNWFFAFTWLVVSYIFVGFDGVGKVWSLVKE